MNRNATARWLETLGQDVRFALRQIVRNPGFAFVAILSLAIGIGANVTIFSAANAFLRREVNATRPDELVRVHRGEHSPLPRDWYLQLTREARTISAAVSEDLLAVGLDRDGTPERVAASVVSENFFTVLGVDAAIGNVFRGEPGEATGAQVVLSHRFWTAKLGADPTVVGRVLRINGYPFSVIGVAREGFVSSEFGWGPEVYVPFSELPRLQGVAADAVVGTSTYVTARLAPGATPDQLAAELRALAPTFARADSTASRPGAFTVRAARGVSAEMRGPVVVGTTFLMAVVALVLLIACANLGNLLLARATARQREIAIRTALGVRRGRLIRQLLTESLVLSLLGAAGGLAIAWYLTRLLPALLPADAPLFLDVSPDPAVLLFAAGLGVACGLLFGLAPALRASRADLHGVLRAAGPGAGRHSRLRSAFLGGQVGLATMLLIVSALFLRGLGAASEIDPGFRSDGIVNVPVDLSLRIYEPARGRLFYDQALTAVRALPNVAEASIIGTPPLSGSNSGTSVLPATAAPDDRQAERGTTFTTVADGYFELVDLPIRTGRSFAPSDREGAPRVAVVNATFARMFWADGVAVGEQFRLEGDDELITVVGVTDDTKYKSLNDAGEPFMYLPIAQHRSPYAVVQARLRADTPAARRELQATIQAIDPALPLGRLQTMEEGMSVALLPAQVGAIFLGAFGGLALLLATIGVYGVTAYVVGQRTNEVGVRTALGAPARAVLRLLMTDTLRVVLAGVAIGVAGGALLGGVVSSQLYGVRPIDPVAFLGATGILVVTAVIGTWIPARRALRGDPLTALRAD